MKHSNTSTLGDSVMNLDQSVAFNSTTKSADDAREQWHELIFLWMTTVLSIGVNGSIALLGVFTNTMNLVVFSRSGILSDSNTVSLTGLAISDFLSCLLLVWACVCQCIILHFYSPNYKWDVVGFLVSTSQRPRQIFTLVTCFVTAYIALERCVAIVFPFKVKYIYTAKHTLCAVCCIFALALVISYPTFLVYFPKWVRNPTNNVSVLTFVRTGIPHSEKTAVGINMTYTAFRAITFVIVVICNVLMIWKLSSRKFRKSKKTAMTTTATAVPTITAVSLSTGTESKAVHDSAKQVKVDKDKRLMSMMMVICVLFNVCYLPSIFITIFIYILYVETEWILISAAHLIGIFLENINSSVNIFIYYSMSSRFKQQFRLLWGIKE